MPNHFHFLIKIVDWEEVSTSKASKTLEELPLREENISKVSKTFEMPQSKSVLTPVEKGFKDFFISYAKAINKKYDRVGSLFQYKFKRKPIKKWSAIL